MGHSKWSTIKRRKGAPDVSFPWTGPTSGDQRRVAMFFDTDPDFPGETVRDLIDGADHAHDEDVLHALVANFAKRHGYEIHSFATVASPDDPSTQTLTIELHRRMLPSADAT